MRRVVPAKAAKFVQSARLLGWVYTARTYGSELLRPSDKDHDPAFDRRYGTDTGGVVRDLAGLGVVGDDRVEEAHSYQGAHPAVVTHALSQLPIEPSSAEFWDLGSGKGRIVLLAAEAGFARSVGVEFATPLHDQAIANERSFRAHHPSLHGEIEFLNRSATEVVWPDEPLVIFLFNPFEGETLLMVRDRIVDRLLSSDKPLWIIYVNPEHLDVFDEARFERHHHIGVNPNYWSTTILRGVPGKG